jgi:hypothetical protein
MPIDRALSALDRCWDDLFCHAPATPRDANAA